MALNAAANIAVSSLLRRHGDDGDADSDAAMNSSMSGMAGMAGMSSSNSSASTASMTTMTMSMPMTIHLSSNDALWLNALTPHSAGSVFGLCLLLLFLGLLSRFLAAVERGANSYYWERETAKRAREVARTAQSANSGWTGAPGGQVRQDRLPWVAGVDLPRGALEMGRMFVSYLLMLAVMTFNFWYFIAVLLGLGLGETFFGRYGRRKIARGGSGDSTSGSSNAGSSDSSNLLVPGNSSVGRRGGGGDVMEMDERKIDDGDKPTSMSDGQHGDAIAVSQLGKSG